MAYEMYSDRIFETLGKYAITATHSWAKISAAIVDNNNVLGKGVNRNKTHPFQLKYAKNKESIYLHAEISAIKNALLIVSPYDISYMDLYVCRMKNINGIMVRGLAKPCEGCMRAIAEFDIKNVYYTTDDGNIEKL